MTRRLLAGVLTALLLMVGLALPVAANHPPTTDSGTDIANIGEAMNQETYWETYFDKDGFSVECTKYENHGGSIPSSYEAAVVKSGSTWVRVYIDPPAQVIGPPNPNAQHPNRRFDPPFSWVMKCDFIPDEETTTTTTIPEDTTTTVPEETTTTTTITTTTTTTLPTTTTTSGDTTTTEPSLREAWFLVDGTCVGEELGKLTITIGVGIDRIDIYYIDPMGDVNLFPGGIPVVDGQVVEKTTDVRAIFEVRAYPREGFEFPFPNQPEGSFSEIIAIDLCDVDVTSTTSSTVLGTSVTTDPDDPRPTTLPFTGAETVAWLFGAISLVGVGWLTLRAGKEQEDG